MAQENEQELDVNAELEEPEAILGEDGTDTTDWEAIAKKNFGMLKRFQTKLKKLSEVRTEAKPAETEAKPQDKKDFDYAKLSYLTAKGIESDEEIALADKWVADTGKELKDVVNNKIFMAELKEMRELKASEAAVPRGTPRSTVGSRDQVDYWIAKGEMPPADQPELQRAYVNAKLKAETSGNKFTKNPVV